MITLLEDSNEDWWKVCSNYCASISLISKGKKYIIFNTELALKLLLLTAFFCQHIFSTGKN